MLRRPNIAALLLITLLLAPLALRTIAQTNEPTPALRLGPADTPPRTNANEAAADSDLFFKKYKEAAQFVRENSFQNASIVMDLLSKSLGTSPWMEIALLKYCELSETRNDAVAMEGYMVLRQRLANAPYFQGDSQRARTFRAALQGAVNNGIDRVRILRIRGSLTQYHSRYAEYPESLAKLAILGYIDIENIHDANNQLFQYVATGQRLTPFISYQQYEILNKISPPDPFLVNNPHIDGTSQVSDAPPKYAAVIRIPGRPDPLRVTEDQTIDGYFIASIAPGGAVVCTYNHILVLPAPE